MPAPERSQVNAMNDLSDDEWRSMARHKFLVAVARR